MRGMRASLLSLCSVGPTRWQRRQRVRSACLLVGAGVAPHHDLCRCETRGAAVAFNARGQNNTTSKDKLAVLRAVVCRPRARASCTTSVRKLCREWSHGPEPSFWSRLECMQKYNVPACSSKVTPPVLITPSLATRAFVRSNYCASSVASMCRHAMVLCASSQ